MNNYDLKTLFELRTITATRPRISTARVFYHNNRAGVCSASGALWPVQFGKEASVHSGDVIVFEGFFEKGLFHIHKIINQVPCLEEWKNQIIPNPIARLDTADKNLDSTSYHPSPSAARFENIKRRNEALERAKQFFSNRGFWNVETPNLVPSGGMEVYLHPFVTEYVDHRNQKWKLQLPTSPEFALKKILTEGVSKIFEVARAFRNGGELSNIHEPEFTMIEWYRVNATLEDILNDTKNLVLVLAEFLGSPLEIPKQWPVFRVDALFQDLLDLKLEELGDRDLFYKNAKPHSISLVDTDDWDSIFCKLFMEKIEPFLAEQKACFVSHYPIQMGALAAQEGSKPFACRAEAFLFGVEICNAYLELVDAKNLKSRFESTKKQSAHLAEDPIFENAMNFGLPPCAGNALGIDRLVALLLNESKISSFYPIPFLSQFLKNTIPFE